MDGLIVFDKGGPTIEPGSWNAVSVTNAAPGLWDCVFSYTSRTADVKRFDVHVGIAINDVGFGAGTVTAIAASTITIRVATFSTAGAAADKSFRCSFKELG